MMGEGGGKIGIGRIELGVGVGRGRGAGSRGEIDEAEVVISCTLRKEEGPFPRLLCIRHLSTIFLGYHIIAHSVNK
jgi:hypothetical protein